MKHHWLEAKVEYSYNRDSWAALLDGNVTDKVTIYSKKRPHVLGTMARSDTGISVFVVPVKHFNSFMIEVHKGKWIVKTIGGFATRGLAIRAAIEEGFAVANRRDSW